MNLEELKEPLTEIEKAALSAIIARAGMHGLLRRLLFQFDAMDAELEMTADKLSDAWLQLDSWASNGVPSPAEVKFTCASLLRQQQAPGWKDGEK